MIEANKLGGKGRDLAGERSGIIDRGMVKEVRN